ncbi:prenyltransferase [Natronococcus sp. A-GB7]|uniref:prenyltransferase n=1 Tax=Natronococcus sp. A-GB7 TaxID=3037649 RepID=UPI00241D9014|nr:prenyltransferase [Natronococcus sp. A-GB7]MDG5818480.1 prenyltransferase [Natronococcus sp. A-GB7]
MTDDSNSADAVSAHGRVVDELSYLLVLSRPRFWLYLAGPVLVGVAYGASSVEELFGAGAVALFAYFLVPANVFLYGVNDIFDRDVDAANPKKEEREVRYRGQRTVPPAVALTGGLGLALFALVPRAAWPWIAGFLVLGAAYSAPPPRFKTTPLLDSVSNGLYIMPGAAAYAAVAGSQPPVLAVLGGWLWAMGMHTFSAIPDIEPDRETGIRTTATVLGEKRTYAYCGACWLASAGAFAALDPRLGAAMAVYPLLVVAIATSSVAVDRAYWWFPAINTVVGAALTMGALRVILHG